MPNITLVISKELKMEMKRHPSVKWSSAVRNAIEQKLADFREAESIAKRSKFSLKDWKPISEKLSRDTAKHAKALLHESNG
ncbi:MAG: hypothetical protein ACP5MZ_02945 [Candidatus Micrarchaeia archaeon]